MAEFQQSKGAFVSPSSLYFRTVRRAPRTPLNASSMHSPRPLRSSWTDLTPRILMYAVARRTDRSGRGRTAGEHEVMFDWVSALKPDSSAIYIPHEYRPIGSKPCRWRWLRLNAELRGRGEAPAMYSGTARRRAALEDPGCLIGVLGLMPGCGRGLRRRVVVATMRSLLSVTPRTLRRDRARNRLRTAADGDRSTAQLSRAVPLRAAADPRARAPRPAGRRPAARPPSARSAG